MFTVTFFNQNGSIDEVTYRYEKMALDAFECFKQEAFKAACERCEIFPEAEVAYQENSCQLLNGGYIEQRFYIVESEDGSEYHGSWAVQLSYLPSALDG